MTDNPRNVGVIEEADGIGQLGDASCGDVFVMYIKVRRGRIGHLQI
jgi:nitrogen fixation NifU-like protein